MKDRAVFIEETFKDISDEHIQIVGYIDLDLEVGAKCTLEMRRQNCEEREFQISVGINKLGSGVLDTVTILAGSAYAVCVARGLFSNVADEFAECDKAIERDYPNSSPSDWLRLMVACMQVRTSYSPRKIREKLVRCLALL